ncbi:MAG: hypothetical protein HAW66_06380 [Shewanella sp.]|nr:hypothetical protein [Shewanella sp.]
MLGKNKEIDVKTVITKLYLLADFISKGGVERVAAMATLFGEDSQKMLTFFSTDVFHNVRSYTSLPRGEKNISMAVGALFKDSVDILAKIYGIEVLKKDRTIKISQISVPELCKVWNSDFQHNAIGVRSKVGIAGSISKVDTFAIEQGKEGFILGEVVTELVMFITAADSLINEQTGTFKKLLSYVFGRGNIHSAMYKFDVLVHCRNWLYGEIASRRSVAIYIDRETWSCGYRDGEDGFCNVSSSNPMSLNEALGYSKTTSFSRALVG